MIGGIFELGMWSLYGRYHKHSQSLWVKYYFEAKSYKHGDSAKIELYPLSLTWADSAL
jgi:hypothetical protein